MRDSSRDPVPQPGDVINQSGHPLDGFVVVSVYTRAQAIADGVIIEVTGGGLAVISAQHFPGVHVAMTAAVAALIQRPLTIRTTATTGVACGTMSFGCPALPR
jgi:hypothetical protein